MTTHTPPLGMKMIAANTSGELYKLSEIATKLQDILAELSQGKASSEKTSKEIQALDYMTQSLVALAGFWEILETDTPEDWSYAKTLAPQSMQLKNLSDLFGGFDQKDTAVQPPTDGACELF